MFHIFRNKCISFSICWRWAILWASGMRSSANVVFVVSGMLCLACRAKGHRRCSRGGTIKDSPEGGQVLMKLRRLVHEL